MTRKRCSRYKTRFLSVFDRRKLIVKFGREANIGGVSGMTQLNRPKQTLNY